MASYEPYDRDRDYGRRYVREDSRRDERDAPRFLDPYGRPPPGGELVPRRQDSDMSVEEIRREFPPPSGRDIRRARSVEGGQPVYWEQEYGRTRGHDSRGYYERERERSYDRRPRRHHHDDYDDDDRKSSKSKGMSKQEKIIAAVAGAALLAGGKELYDRREAKEHHGDVQRNPLSSVALAGLGALAGYQGAEFYSKQQAKRDQKANYILQRGRDGNMHEYYSDDDDGSKEKKGHKNFLENALAATGLGAAVKQLTGGGGDDRRSERGGSRRGSPSGTSRAGSRERSGGTNKIQKAAMASLLAGATEAFRVSKEPGGWRGEKAKRILTAAAGAATVDATVAGDHGKLGLAESVIGGLVGNRLINGSKRDIEEDKATGRSRSRSRAASRGGSGGGGGAGLAALATAGLGALGAKKMIDHSRSRSRGRDRSPDSRESSPDRPRLRSRSRSVVDKARNSLARLGIGSSDDRDDHRRRDQDDYDDYDRGSRGGGSSRRYHDDEYDDRDRHSRSGHGGGSTSGRDRSRDRRRGGGYGSGSDLGDSEDDERRHRKMRGKQIITTGLATVATIHAAHEVYQSVEKRNARQRAVRDGRLSSMEAKKLKTKALMQDAASVGIAAMGIKGALSEMKEAKELNHECKEFRQLKAKRHARRLQQRKRLDGDHMSDHEERFEPKRLRRPGTWAGPVRRWEDGAPPLPPPIEQR